MKAFISVVAASIVIAATQAMAVPLTFFAEDRGVFNQDGSPTGAGFATAQAAEAAFLANLMDVGTEDFESFADGTGTPLALSFPGAGTATLSGSGEVDDDPGTGQNATSGSQWWRTGADNDFSILFDSPVAAFGFYGIDVGDTGAQLTLTLMSGASLDIDIPHTVEPGGPDSGQNGSVFFFGYIDEDNPFTMATFNNSGASGDDFGFDDMTIGSALQVSRVPEPGTMALFGIGSLLLGIGRARRRRER